MDFDLKGIGNKIRQLRKENKLTQAQLAAVCYINRSSIGLYENGLREPSAGTIAYLAKYFNVSVDYLLGVDECKQRNNIDMQTKLYKIGKEHELLKERIETLDAQMILVMNALRAKTKKG